MHFITPCQSSLSGTIVGVAIVNKMLESLSSLNVYVGDFVNILRDPVHTETSKWFGVSCSSQNVKNL